jgi:2-polyprenyl-3-methyl-5-hydroxy-6-metoxy-1,4-benzoquinol methylase
MKMNKIKLPTPTRQHEFTGERLVLGVGLDIEHEHYHRYVWAADMCAGKTVLDVASGDGYGSYILSQCAASVCGCEINESVVLAAREKYVADNLSYYCGDCKSTPFDDAQFDIVVSFETIEHIHEYKAFVREVRRVLKPEGVFICSTPETHEFRALSQVEDNEFHVHEFEKEEFVALLQGEFNLVGLVGQSFAASSMMWPLRSGLESLRHYHAQDGVVSQSDSGLIQPTFLVAVASNWNLPPLYGSYFSSQESKRIVSELLIEKFSLLDEKARRDEQLDVAQHELNIARSRIAGFENSFSWRITAPVRALSARFSSVSAFVKNMLMSGSSS